MATIVVSGAIANKYLKAGEAWHRLQWVLGLKRLGHTVFFVEQIAKENCLDAEGAITEFERCVNLRYLQQIASEFGWRESAVLICDDGDQIDGMSLSELKRLADETDLLINISGHLTLEPLMQRFRRKLYLDEDPGFTQFWQASGNSGLRLEGYDYYFTIGENIGASGCSIPSGGIRWRTTRPFVVLDQWPVANSAALDRFTTIGSWRGPYGPVEFEGKTYGLKVHEFRKFIDLPRRTSIGFEMALDIHPADEKDLQLLRGHGWHIVDPKRVVPDVNAFRRYVQSSGAEFSVAKGIYVDTHSGWVSDRSVRYLACGKPVLVQETGFSQNYSVGIGMVPFCTMEEAVAGSQRIAVEYARHGEAARQLAERYFDSDLVLGKLLAEVGIVG